MNSFTHITKYVALYGLFLVTFGLAGLDKFLTEGVPGWFTQQFGETFLATLPGLSFAYYKIALLEVAVVLIFVTSFVRGEFLENRDRSFLKLGLALSLIVFVVLGFGLRLTKDFGGAANLFFYFGATLVCLFVVQKDEEVEALKSMDRERQGHGGPTAAKKVANARGPVLVTEE